MNIEAVSVCVNYGDILAEVASRNVGHLDRWIIVTTPEDEQTRTVCHRHDLECVLSHDYDRGGEFNKGRMVDKGLMMLSKDSWRLHIDADIVLPQQFRKQLAGAHLQTEKIYGCDRTMIRSWEQWQQMVKSGWKSHNHCNVNFPHGYDIGDRWALGDTGYVPIGFFQMWHSDGDEFRGRRFRRYPISHGTACRTDVQFAQQWDIRDRQLIPEILVFHLESEQGPLGMNWKGRTSKPFGPPCDTLPLRPQPLCKPIS